MGISMPENTGPGRSLRSRSSPTRGLRSLIPKKGRKPRRCSHFRSAIRKVRKRVGPEQTHDETNCTVPLRSKRDIRERPMLSG